MRKKILIIDDNELNRRLFRDVLISEGFEAIDSPNGGDAQKLALNLSPDLIVMDMCMPDLDGIEATRMLKRDHRLEGIPVIAVTALRGEEHAAKAKEEGCADYLLKPVSIPGFLKSVNHCLN